MIMMIIYIYKDTNKYEHTIYIHASAMTQNAHRQTGKRDIYTQTQTQKNIQIYTDTGDIHKFTQTHTHIHTRHGAITQHK